MQGIAEEHRVRSETIEVQIRHNRKEHERLVQEHAQSKGKIQALEEELRDVNSMMTTTLKFLCLIFSNVHVPKGIKLLLKIRFKVGCA